MYKPNFTITQKILKDIGKVEACREVINNAPLVPAWEVKFREDAIIRAVHYGTHVEGNELNLEEAKAVIEGKEIAARQRDVQEVINYRNVLKYIDELALNRASQNFIINEKIIHKIHQLTIEKIVPDEQSGNYRTVQVHLRGVLTGEIVFRPPPAVEVPFQMETFLEWLNSAPSFDLHEVLKAGIAHHELVRIHPFIEGNGRVARAVCTLILFTGGYDIRRLFSLEEYYDQNVQSYYYALSSVSPEVKNDLTPWLEYFIEGLAIELSRVKEKIQKLSHDTRLKERIGGRQIFLNERQVKIIEYLEKNGHFQNKVFAELFPMVSEDSVLRDLQDLMKKNIIKKTGRTKAARYIMK